MPKLHNRCFDRISYLYGVALIHAAAAKYISIVYPKFLSETMSIPKAQAHRMGFSHHII